MMALFNLKRKVAYGALAVTSLLVSGCQSSEEEEVQSTPEIVEPENSSSTQLFTFDGNEDFDSALEGVLNATRRLSEGFNVEVTIGDETQQSLTEWMNAVTGFTEVTLAETEKRVEMLQEQYKGIGDVPITGNCALQFLEMVSKASADEVHAVVRSPETIRQFCADLTPAQK